MLSSYKNSSTESIIESKLVTNQTGRAEHQENSSLLIPVITRLLPVPSIFFQASLSHAQTLVTPVDMDQNLLQAQNRQMENCSYSTRPSTPKRNNTNTKKSNTSNSGEYTAPNSSLPTCGRGYNRGSAHGDS